MSQINVLVVEGETAVRELVAFVLERFDFSVTPAANVEEAEALLNDLIPDLIVLDWMLPGLSGVEWARRLKRDRILGDIPIVLLTARGEEEDQIQGLEIGADDYVAKPFSPRELVARVKTVLRRRGTLGEEPIEMAGISLDPQGHRIAVGSHLLSLTPLEYRLLEFFLTHPDKAYSRSQLLHQVWGRSSCADDRTVDVHIRRLRKALGEHGREELIQTVRGFGYRFSEKGVTPKSGSF
jgi:two-component system phosphate regulon response regulator PhoB